MTVRGKVKGGVVVLESGVQLPEGTEVTISMPDEAVDSDVEEMRRDLLELAKWAESQPCDLPADFAENHDHYLHGLPKRKP